MSDDEYEVPFYPLSDASLDNLDNGKYAASVLRDEYKKLREQYEILRASVDTRERELLIHTVAVLAAGCAAYSRIPTPANQLVREAHDLIAAVDEKLKSK